MRDTPNTEKPSNQDSSHTTNDDATQPLMSSLGLPLIEPTKSLHLKAIALMVLTAVIALSALIYMLYARGVFEDKQTLILTADNSEGISIGMDMTFSGFPIGSVQKIELADDGTVRIFVSIPEKNAHRLRDSSLFTLVRNILGATSLKAYTSDWDDAPLPDDAVRAVLYGDASAEIPQLMASARTVLDNVGALTGAQSSLAQSINHISTLTSKLSAPDGKTGLLAGILGSDSPEAKQVEQALTNLNSLMQQLNQMAKNANAQVFGSAGLMKDAQGSTQELQKLLADARQSLQKIDAILDDAKNISGNVSDASVDLNALREEVNSSVRKVDGILSQITNTWPFANQKKVELP